jgi:gas vesicle protein
MKTTIDSTIHDLKNGASAAANTAEHIAEATKGGFGDVLSKLGKAYGIARSFHLDDLVERAGYTRRSSTLGTIATFTSGFALGAGAALLVAPTSGRKLRRRIASAVKSFVSAGEEKAATLAKDAEDAAHALKGAAHAVGTEVTEVREAVKDGFRAKGRDVR